VLDNTDGILERARLGRAGCQNSACKKAQVKIAKNEFRMGTLVPYKDTQSWQWKHWYVVPSMRALLLIPARGCVTPHNLAKLKDLLEGLDIDDDHDMDIIDGWDTLDEEARGLLRQAIKDGHVGDDVWKGVNLLSAACIVADSLPGTRAQPTGHERYQQAYSKEEGCQS
jgi:hypothetical protein